MSFNIHYHEGKQVVFPLKKDSTAAARGKLAVSSDQSYCWMWKNPGKTLSTLRLQLSR